jgi:uncharacterized protein (DUF1501 family)
MTDRSCRTCNEFARATLFRRAAAEAGRGLPSIEPGMPLPAGTGLDRRAFISRTAGMALVVYGTSRLSPLQLDDGIASAAAGRAADRVLVSIFLPGGADGLSVLYPAGDARYRRLRPNLAMKDEDGIPLTGDNRLHWHPSLAPLATELYAHGKVTVFPAIGYSHPDQSHFTSRHYWEVGALDVNLRTGWLGRYLDLHGNPDNAMQGLSLDGQLLPSLASAKTPVSTIASPEEYRFQSRNVWDDAGGLLEDAVGGLGGLRRDADRWLAAASSTALESDRLRRRLGRFLDKDGHARIHSPGGLKYPDGDFARRLQALAAMLGAGFPVRTVAVTAPGNYDTHAEEPGALADGLKQVAETLVVFQQDLEGRRLGSCVLTLVWTEFGRRAAENASRGTDHGAAGVAFLIGSGTRGTIVGGFPGLSNGLDGNGNLRATADFRSVYASLLEQWFGVDADPIIPDAKRMKRLKLVG